MSLLSSSARQLCYQREQEHIQHFVLFFNFIVQRGVCIYKYIHVTHMQIIIYLTHAYTYKVHMYDAALHKINVLNV